MTVTFRPVELDLRHLRMVVAVAESGSVTKAAATLGIAQPALTAQLNRIDRALGGSVFVRDRSGARPTELGELVLRHARVLLPAMSALADDARRLVNAVTGHAGVLRVGTVGTGLGGLFVNHLHGSVPGVRITTSTPASVDDLANRLANGTLDVALVGLCSAFTPPQGGEVLWTRVCTDPMFVLLDERHALAGKDEVSLSDLAEERWLYVPAQGCLEECFVTACVRAGFAPHGLGEAEWTAAVDQVRAGRAVALVEPGQPDPPGVRAVALEGSPLRRTHYVGWRRESGDRAGQETVEDAAYRAHRDSVRRSPHYGRWLTEYGALA